MTTLTESLHAGGFMVSEADGTLSREQVTLKSGQNLLAGTVLGKLLTGTAAATAYAGNAGSEGAMGAITVTSPAKAGTYRLTILDPVTNAGAFVVEGPDGIEIGTGKVATAFSAGGLAFTLADGGTDYIAGEGFTILVTATAIKYVVFDPTATDGSQNAAAILYQDTDATSADHPAAIIARNAEVNSAELVWGANVTTAGQKTAALAQLAAFNIIAR
jgi:hypothetical protein